MRDDGVVGKGIDTGRIDLRGTPRGGAAWNKPLRAAPIQAVCILIPRVDLDIDPRERLAGGLNRHRDAKHLRNWTLA